MWGNESHLNTDGNKQIPYLMDKIHMSMEKYVGITSILYRQWLFIVSIDDFID